MRLDDTFFLLLLKIAFIAILAFFIYFRWQVVLVTGIFIGSLLLYDSYRKEQKMLEQPKPTESKGPVQQDAKFDPLKDFSKL